MAKKQHVKLGISLVAITLLMIFAMSRKSYQKKHHTQTNDQQKLSLKEATAENVLSYKDKDCHKLKDIVTNKALKNEHIRWTNYFLLKDKKEFVLRIEKDVNKQGLEIERIKFYSLDEDGFPTAYGDLHNQVVQSKEQIQNILKQYKLESKKQIASFNNLMIEKEDQKILAIKDQMNNKECVFD